MTIPNGVSHPTRDAWIETAWAFGTMRLAESHPTRGAWIETSLNHRLDHQSHSRTPPGVRGLKLRANWFVRGQPQRRTPPRGRGLKLLNYMRFGCVVKVAPHPGCVD